MNSYTAVQRTQNGHQRFFAVSLFSCLAIGSALGQWPTSYQSPKVLSSGAGFYVADVLAMDDGGVVTVHDQSTSGIRSLKVLRFASNGESHSPGNIQTQIQPYSSAKAELFSEQGPLEGGFALGVHQSRNNISSHINPGRFYRVSANGNWSTIQSVFYFGYEAATPLINGFAYLAHNPETRELSIFGSVSEPNSYFPLGWATPSDTSIIATGDQATLSCFTKKGLTPGTPSEVWVLPYDAAVLPRAFGTAQQAESQPGLSQSKGKILPLGAAEIMLTWLGDSATSQSLYVKKINDLGVETDDTDHVMSNVTDYAITTSTLGTPVYAFVQKDPLEASPVGTLYGGLLDPASGFSLNVPIATGADIKIKALRQEENGDFSLVYSVFENGTTLLKVRRVSGTTAGTLWETVAADLGLAPADRIEQYNNAFISGKDNILHILSRYDRPHTEYTEFHITRVRQDGQLGADPLAAPVNFEASNLAAGNVQLRWDRVSNSETHYVIARVEENGPGLEILGTVSAETRAYIDTTAEAGKTYTYYVAAYQAYSGDYVVSEPKTYLIEPN